MWAVAATAAVKNLACDAHTWCICTLTTGVDHAALTHSCCQGTCSMAHSCCQGTDAKTHAISLENVENVLQSDQSFYCLPHYLFSVRLFTQYMCISHT